MADAPKPAVTTVATPPAAEKEPTTLRDRLIRKAKFSAAEADQFLAYVQGEKTREAASKAKDPKAFTPVTNNTEEQQYTMAFKWHAQGLIIDGVNVVITGRGMSMVTYNGYKNKVKQVYPDATFDIQLVRQGDDFKVAKENGSVIYTHNFGDPFGNKEIIGAYCVIKFGNNDYFEALGKEDYEKMKSSSKNPTTWNKWASEFWLKSVIKRACKRHFNDITVELDRMDNDDFGLSDKSKVAAAPDKQAAIIAAAKKNDSST